jgi:hypothetical protein
MTTHLYTVCWNEADMLGFFFRHYDPWVDRYVIHDNGSTDGSLELLHAHPRVEVRSFEWVEPDSFLLSHQAMHNHVWKESRGLADWVVITSIDEHLVVPDCPMRTYLEECDQKGITLLPALGYQMLSEEFPEPDETLCVSRTWGAPWRKMSKLSIWNPEVIEETNYSIGRHEATPMGRVKLARRDELLLLHYKYIGFERTLARHATLLTGLGSKDTASDGGQFKYTWSREQLREDWDQIAARAVDVTSPDLRPWSSHLERRWWRRKLRQRLRRRAALFIANRRG